MRARSQLHQAGIILLVLSLAVGVGVHAQAQAVPPPTPLSMDDAVRLALEHNQGLRALRLTIDESKADEITAGLKPNPTLSLAANGFTPFSPRQMNWSFLNSGVAYSGGIDYNFERGGKRDKRLLVARDATDVTAKGVLEAERQLRYQAQQAFINVLLAKSTLALAQDDLKNFANVVEVNQQRVTSGDLAQGDFLQIKVQQLQFEQDVKSAELSIIETKSALRQLAGFDTLPDDFDVAGDLVYTKIPITLESLRQAALVTRPDLLAAQSSVTLAQDQAALEVANRALDLDGNLGYTRNGGASDTVGVGVAINLPFHDRNQGNIAHTQIAIHQAQNTETATRFSVLTDVTNAYAEFHTNDAVVTLYQSGYLDQAKELLDIRTYIFQRGAGNLLDLLDAERSYRAIQLAYRQALAAYMTSLQQLNFVVGKQVIP